MKIINVFLSVFFIAALMFVIGFVRAVENSEDSIFNADASDIYESTDTISASDIADADEQVELEKIMPYFKKTMSKGSGWVATSDKGALAQLHLVSGYSNNKTISKGWLKVGNLKLKIESTSNSETNKTFDVAAGGGSVIGTLVLNKGKSYQTGFALWDGRLNIKLENNKSYEADVNLAIYEKQIGKDRLRNQTEKDKISYTGSLELMNIKYELKRKSTSKLDRLEFDITGNDAEGKLVLEKIGSEEYVGKLKIEKSGNDEDDDKIEGRVSGTLTLTNNTLSGPIKFEDDGGSAITEGRIEIIFSRKIDYSDDSDDDNKIKRGSGSGSSENSGSEKRGFWRRFIDFFGA